MSSCRGGCEVGQSIHHSQPAHHGPCCCPAFVCVQDDMEVRSRNEQGRRNGSSAWRHGESSSGAAPVLQVIDTMPAWVPARGTPACSAVISKLLVVQCVWRVPEHTSDNSPLGGLAKPPRCEVPPAAPLSTLAPFLPRTYTAQWYNMYIQSYLSGALRRFPPAAPLSTLLLNPQASTIPC